MTNRASDVSGTALLVVLMAVLLLAGIALALGLGALSDNLASSNLRVARGLLYAAEAGLERAMPDLLRVPDWDRILDGGISSGFTDGPPSGSRAVPGGDPVELSRIVNLANCQREDGCAIAAMNAVTEDRPWGENNPRWRLFAWGTMSALVPGIDPAADAYLVVLVGDDPAENDADPTRDGRGPNPGSGVLCLRAHAFGRAGGHRTVEMIVTRTGQHAPGGPYPGQRGQSSAPSGQSAQSVEIPGGSLTRTEVTLRNQGE